MIRLSPVQADEVSGLLDVCTDDVSNGDRTTEPWGRLDGRDLTVVDPTEAVMDLRDRARWHMTEGYVADMDRRARYCATRLRDLADRIEGGQR